MELFDAVPNEYTPYREEECFMKQRDKLEEQTAWSFEAFVQNYEKLKAYGLDEKLINQLEWLIVFYLENRKEEFLKSEFYERFQDHEVVQKAKIEYERRINL